MKRYEENQPSIPTSSSPIQNLKSKIRSPLNYGLSANIEKEKENTRRKGVEFNTLLMLFIKSKQIYHPSIKIIVKGLELRVVIDSKIFV